MSLRGGRKPDVKHFPFSLTLLPRWEADLRTDDAKLVRIASRLSQLGQSPYGEILGAWSKSKTKVGEARMRVESKHLDCFGSKEPRNDEKLVAIRSFCKISPLQVGGRSCACVSKLQMRGGGSSRRANLNSSRHLQGFSLGDPAGVGSNRLDSRTSCENDSSLVTLPISMKVRCKKCLA